MSLFFGRAERRSGLADQWFNIDPDYQSVTSANATHLAPVFAAVRHVVDFVSTLPVDSYRGNPDGSRTETVLPQMLRSQNAIGRPGIGQWIGQAAYGLVTVGNAVGWVVETDGFGYPAVVRWLPPRMWSYDEAAQMWRVGGQIVSHSQILHIPWIVPTGMVLGLSPIEHYASIVKAGLSAQDYADMKRGGGMPPSVLKNTARTLNPAESLLHRDRASASFASGKPFVTGADWDLTLTTIPPNHAQFIETLNLSAVQIAAIYGIDPREIGGHGGDSLTYKTDESRSLNRANNMRPYIVRLEDAFNRVLPERQFVKLNVDSTIRTDLKTRTEVEDIRLKNGTLSQNDVRALEDEPPIPGGDTYTVVAPATPAAPPATSQGETP